MQKKKKQQQQKQGIRQCGGSSSKNKVKKKYCVCGHVVEEHDMQKGCVAIVEGRDCEDHWVCGCRCTPCIHLSDIRCKLANNTLKLEQGNGSYVVPPFLQKG